MSRLERNLPRRRVFVSVVSVASAEDTFLENARSGKRVSQLTAITKLLEIQSQNRLPLPEPGIFSGDHPKYPTWIRAFESLVESKATKPSDRLYFLSRYVSGEAKEVIQGFMLMEGDDAYQKAKEVLHKRYGDSFALAAAFRKKLDV